MEGKSLSSKCIQRTRNNFSSSPLKHSTQIFHKFFIAEMNGEREKNFSRALIISFHKFFFLALEAMSSEREKRIFPVEGRIIYHFLGEHLFSLNFAFVFNLIAHEEKIFHSCFLCNFTIALITELFCFESQQMMSRNYFIYKSHVMSCSLFRRNLLRLSLH